MPRPGRRPLATVATCPRPRPPPPPCAPPPRPAWRPAARAPAPRPRADLALDGGALTAAAPRGVVARVAAGEGEEDPPYRQTLEEIEEVFAGSWRDPSTDTIGGFDADGV